MSHPAEYLSALVQFKESLPPSRGFRRADPSDREGSEEPMRLKTCPTLETLSAFLRCLRGLPGIVQAARCAQVPARERRPGTVPPRGAGGRAMEATQKAVAQSRGQSE